MHNLGHSGYEEFIKVLIIKGVDKRIKNMKRRP